MACRRTELMATGEARRGGRDDKLSHNGLSEGITETEGSQTLRDHRLSGRHHRL